MLPQFFGDYNEGSLALTMIFHLVPIFKFACGGYLKGVNIECDYIGGPLTLVLFPRKIVSKFAVELPWQMQKVYFCMMDHYIMAWWILLRGFLSPPWYISTKPSWELLCQLCSSIYMHTKFSYKSTNFHTMKMSHLELYINQRYGGLRNDLFDIISLASGRLNLKGLQRCSYW